MFSLLRLRICLELKTENVLSYFIKRHLIAFRVGYAALCWTRLKCNTLLFNIGFNVAWTFMSQSMKLNEPSF